MTLSYFAGTRLTTTTFNAIFDMYPRTFVKSSDQTYNTQTTFQNDTHLTCSLEAASTYEVVMNLVMSGTDGDIKTKWLVPSDATGYKICQGPALTSTDREDTNMATAAHNLATVRNYGLAHLTNYAGAREAGLIVTTTAGTLVLQHAQNSSTANNSGLITNSWMTIRKIA